MRDLNHRHLRAFWMAARCESLVRAAAAAHLTPQTLCAHIKQLERTIDMQLFSKIGRRLELTPEGSDVLRYADAIFAAEAELCSALDDRGHTSSTMCRTGIVDTLPKSVAYRLLRSVLESGSVRLQARSGAFEGLLRDLAARQLDVVITDAPAAASSSYRAYSHHLGRSGIGFFCTPRLAEKARGSFPSVLQGLPMLMPGPSTPVHARLRRWLDARGLRLETVGEFDDGALMKAFGQHGHGVFAAPVAMESYIRRRYGVRCIGRTDEVFEDFYAVTLERKARFKPVAAMIEASRNGMFG